MLIKNNDLDKYKYFGYKMTFNARGTFSLSDGSGIGKNVIEFGPQMSFSVHVDNRKK